MSEIDNKVRWCLKKAEKELANSRKHRGLVKIVSDIKGAEKHLNKAQHNFHAAVFFEKHKYSDWSVSALFYTIYHCFLAIALKFGYESRNQECTVSLIEQLKSLKKIDFDMDIIQAIKVINDSEKHEFNVIELRENFQYGTETQINYNELDKLKDLCRRAIDQSKHIVYNN